MCQGMVGQEAAAARVPAPGGPETAAGADASALVSGLDSRSRWAQSNRAADVSPPFLLNIKKPRDIPAVFVGSNDFV